MASVLALTALAGLGARPTAALIDSATVSMDCTGWAVTALPFDFDPDGDGMVTVRIQVFDGSLDPVLGPVLADETFTFPVGTTQDVSGAFSQTPTVNAMVMVVSGGDGNLVNSEMLGACGQNGWMRPAARHMVPTLPGDTELGIAAFGSCYGTTLATELRNPSGAAAGSWVVPMDERDPHRAILSLPLPAPLVAGSYAMDAVCGTFDAPSSAVESLTIDVFADTPTTESAPPAEPTSAAATFTG